MKRDGKWRRWHREEYGGHVVVRVGPCDDGGRGAGTGGKGKEVSNKEGGWEGGRGSQEG
jgi:hypothetical protein